MCLLQKGTYLHLKETNKIISNEQYDTQYDYAPLLVCVGWTSSDIPLLSLTRGTSPSPTVKEDS